MRKFILIAGFALVSVAAHAGDRGLSMGGGEATSVSAAARVDGQRTAEAPQAAEAPRYVERPAVEPKAEATRPETTRSESARSETSRASAGNAARMRQRQAMQQRYAGRPQGAGGASARKAAMMQRQAGAHRARYSIKARILSALYRHGIYW